MNINFLLEFDPAINFTLLNIIIEKLGYLGGSVREGEGKVSFGENALRKRSRVASAGTVVLNIGACAGDKDK